MDKVTGSQSFFCTHSVLMPQNPSACGRVSVSCEARALARCLNEGQYTGTSRLQQVLSTSSYLIFLFKKVCLTFSDTMHVEEITIDREGTEVLQSPEPKNQKLETDTFKESSNSILMK